MGGVENRFRDCSNIAFPACLSGSTAVPYLHLRMEKSKGKNGQRFVLLPLAKN